ncbi:hypothetical protein QUF76_01420 [Desulfobacterales bacterium HSG16]|nr:hypothetical protein [Desulfobacterales bacterium HSG16]
MTIIMTTFNILFFLLGLVLFYVAGRRMQAGADHKSGHQEDSHVIPDKSVDLSEDQDRILKIYRDVAAKVERIKNLHISGSDKIGGATEDSIRQFSNLIERLHKTTGKTREILDLMGIKISLSLVKNIMGKKPGKASAEETRKRYEQLIKDVMEQLSLITAQKQEDLARLDKIMAMMTGQPGESAESDGNSVVASLKDAINIESSFMQSTMLLLQDLILSLVDSFVQLNSLMDSTLGESSSVGDEINAIVVNLQCEDICNELSEYTINILSSVMDDLNGLDIAGVVKDDLVEIGEEEKQAALTAADSEQDDDEEVIFF